MSLNGFTTLGDSTLINDIRENVVSFFDYGLMEKGNIINVPIPTTGVYGGLDHRLHLTDDPRYTSGQVWSAFRGNWVWETGVGALVGDSGVSGVFVNSVFRPASGTGAYAHHIDHRNGQVVFNTAISTSATVDCAYSYKYVNVTKVDGLPWFVELQKRSTSDTANFIAQSGESSFLPENRLQLPALGVELTNLRKLVGHQLGGGQRVNTGLLIHCVAEDSYMRDSLVDIVTYQKDKSFYMYDLNEIADSGAFPLDYRGVPQSGALRYPELVETYKGRKITFLDCTLDSVYSLGPNLHVGTVKITTEVVHFGV